MAFNWCDCDRPSCSLSHERKLTGAAKRAQEYEALQDLRAKLVRKYEDLELEIADIDRQLETRER